MCARVSSSPLLEVYLLVEQPRQRVSHWTQALAPLDGPDAPALTSVDAYYDAGATTAIFGLRYDERWLGPERLSFVHQVARLAELGVIQPAELSDGDRRRFETERLAGCAIHVADHRKVVGALVELVRRVRGAKPSTSPPQVDTLGGQMVTRARTAVPLPPGAHEQTNESMVLIAKGTRKVEDTARGTREVDGRGTLTGSAAEGRGSIDEQPTRELARGSSRQPRLERDEAVPEAELTHVVSEPIEVPIPPSAQGSGVGIRPSPNVIARSGVHRANTVLLTPSETARMIEAAQRAYDQADVDTADSDATTEPFLPTAPDLAPTTMIYARYLRSGRWVPIRIGSLSLKGAALLTGALPRLEDRVDIALSFGYHRALVRGVVTKVSTVQESALSGATTFTVAFELDDASRRQLTSLLTAARSANITIKPPPARSTRRYTVEWPVALGTTRGAVRADALDVSADGMFVRPVHPLALDARLTFTAMLDDGQTSVSGRARVVRSISEVEARIAGLSSGFGVTILEMTDADRERWAAFLNRVEKRAGKRVLIGASPARLAELQAGLVAAGYAVIGGTEPGALAHLAGAEARPVDAALVDAAWVAAGSSPAWIEELFAGRNVPCVTMNGDARRARVAIDRLLAVV